MGLFDQMVGGLVNSVLGQAGGSGGLGGLLNTALSGGFGDALPGMVNNALAKTEFGNLEGLVTQLQAGGLGEAVTSWLSSGPNLEITAEQITSAIGTERLGQMSAALGLPADTVQSLLAQHLPTLIDKLSPDGALHLPTA